MKSINQKSKSAIENAIKGLNGQPILLVGMMGVGKSTIGRRLAAILNMPFADVDDEIIISANMDISDIFENHGEDHFREGERKVIQRLMDGKQKVIATGGGAFINEQTRALILKQSVSIWLYAELDILVSRVNRRNNRPLLKNGDPKKIISELSKIRDPIYALAQYHIRTDNAPHSKTAINIIKALSV